MKYEIIFNVKISADKIDNFEKKIKEILDNKDFQTKISNLDFEKVVFSVGGDGTFLDAVRETGYKNLFIPINEGTLGFYTSWSMDNIEEIISKNTNVMSAPLLELKLDDQTFYSVNEATIINPINTQILEIYINDEHFENFRGTGICISTPTGSTAYNKSLGGALIDPKKDLFQLIKIAPINNVKYRNIENSIILSKEDKLTIKFEDENILNSILTIDRKNLNLKSNYIEFSLSKKKLNILTNDTSFYTRVKSNFLLGDENEKK